MAEALSNGILIAAPAEPSKGTLKKPHFSGQLQNIAEKSGFFGNFLASQGQGNWET